MTVLPQNWFNTASEGPASKEGLSLKWDAVKAILHRVEAILNIN